MIEQQPTAYNDRTNVIAIGMTTNNVAGPFRLASLHKSESQVKHSIFSPLTSVVPQTSSTSASLVQPRATRLPAV